MKSPESDLIRLSHMLDYAQKAVQFTKGYTRADFDSNEMLALAVIHLIEISGKPPKVSLRNSGKITLKCRGNSLPAPETVWLTAISTSTWMLSGQSLRRIYQA
jgi:hypothetical protein